MLTYSCSFPNKSFLKWQDYYADEIGVLSPNQMQVEELYAGEVKFPFWMTLIRMGFCVACLGCFLVSKNMVFGRKLQNGLMILLYFDHINDWCLITQCFLCKWHHCPYCSCFLYLQICYLQSSARLLVNLNTIKVRN